MEGLAILHQRHHSSPRKMAWKLAGKNLLRPPLEGHGESGDQTKSLISFRLVTQSSSDERYHGHDA
jgi:hypothetical protein